MGKIAALYIATLISADYVIPAKAGIQKKPGFRVKPGMTNYTGIMSLCIVYPFGNLRTGPEELEGLAMTIVTILNALVLAPENLLCVWENNMDEYEIYAIKYAGPLESSGAFVMWNREWEKTVKRNYYIWCIRGAGQTVIVDAGVSPELASEKNLNGYVSPAEVLSRIHVKADEIRHVVITHIHWDHTSGVNLFPKAAFYIQDEEYRFWLKDPVAKRPPFELVSDDAAKAYLASLEGTDHLALLRGDQEILPGIECLLSPGHTVALQAVAVNTAKGTAILGSDCAHLFRNYREDWPSSLIVDLVGWMKSYEKLRAKASSIELIFPGHDVLMAENYPQVAKDITRLV